MHTLNVYIQITAGIATMKEMQQVSRDCLWFLSIPPVFFVKLKMSDVS